MAGSKYQIDKDKLSEKQRNVYDQVEYLYYQTNRHIARWLWANHVQTVGYFALELAKKYSADADVCFSAALLHDIADIWDERDHPGFEVKTKHTSQDVLKQAGFDQEIWLHTFDRVIAPHSCYPGNMPDNLEAKVLATADAMAHLLTNFYKDFQEMGVPTDDKEKFKEWVLSKLERDFHRKIFFPEVKGQVKPNYEQLKTYFQTGEKEVK